MAMGQVTEKAAQAAKKAHEKELLSLPAVVGVGVTSVPEGPALAVYLSEDDAATRQHLPQRLDGVPVEVFVVGELRPLKDHEP